MSYLHQIKTFVADPPGSVLYSWITKNTLERSGNSITEGIGQGRVCETRLAQADNMPVDNK